MPGRGRGRGARNGHSQDETSIAVATASSARLRGLADIVDRYERLGHSNANASPTVAVVGTSVNSGNISGNNNINSNGSTTVTRTSVASSSPGTGSCTNEDGKLSTFIPPQELSRLLECPVCYEITLPPVIMCTAGHNLCSECRNKCTRCPVCRSGFCEARNRLAESIVDKCSIQCRYRSLGCSHILGGRLMAAHLDQECEYRPIHCRDCKLKIPYDNYISHLLNDERLPRQIATECSTGFDIEEDDFVQSALGGPGQSWEPTWLHCYGLDFFCHLETLGNYWWIYVIGLATESTLSNYLCDILVWNRDKKQELRFHGPVHSFRRSGEEILESGQCIITSQSAIRSILNQGGIDVVVCIFKVSDYQTPKSRNTGQPIFSPLILRGNNITTAGGGAAGDSNSLNLNNVTHASPRSGSGVATNNMVNLDNDSRSLEDSIIEIIEVVEPSTERVAMVAPFNTSDSTDIDSTGIAILEMLRGLVSQSNNGEVEVEAGGDTDIMVVSENSSHRNSSTSTRSGSSQLSGSSTSAVARIGEVGSGVGEDGERRGRNRIPRESARAVAPVRARSLDGARRRRHTQRQHNPNHQQT